MEKINIPISSLLRPLITAIMLSIIFLGCGRYECGDGAYNCDRMFSTKPYATPLKYDYYNEVILLSDGNILGYYGREITGPVLYDLKHICSTDTICDFEIYNYHILKKIYDSYSYYYIPDSSAYISVLSPNKCSKLAAWNSPLLEFGNTGPLENRINNAVSMAINRIGEIFIADSGDNSIKKYDSNGNLISRFDVDYPTKIRAYEEKLYVMSNRENSITLYDFNGIEKTTSINLSSFNDVVAFDLYDTDNLILVDQGGSRISLIYYSGKIVEDKYGYCFLDVNFSFGNITDVDFDDPFFYCVDNMEQYVLNFREFTYY